MTVLQALFLGLIQGATEFFPISSSAHLQIGEALLGISGEADALLFFHLVCHSGTLLALCFEMRSEIFSLLQDKTRLFSYGLALFPLALFYFFLKPLRVFLSAPSFLPYFLAATGALLFFASRKKVAVFSPSFEGNPPEKPLSMVCIGLAQACALIPGLSRSGSTMAAGRLLFGWSWAKAARVSFLLSIPAILGGQCLEMLRWIASPAGGSAAYTPACYLAGFSAAFLVGRKAWKLAFWVYEQGRIFPLALYCWALALWMYLYG